MNEVRVRVVGGAVVVGLAVVASVLASTVVASRAYVARGREQSVGAREITVKGSARLRTRSDLGQWSLTVRGEAADLPGAYARLEDGVGRVAAFLAARGFAAPEVALSAIDTVTHHVRDKEGRETRQVEGYTLERVVSVRSGDVDRFASAASEVTALLRDGVTVESSRPCYYFTKAGELKVRLLGAASEDARARADEIAGRTGCRVTEVRRAQMGPIQIVAPDAVDASSGGTYDVGTVDKDVWVVVTATFGLDG